MVDYTMKKSVSLVTGASSGLGRNIAKLLCEEGHLVYVTARRKEKLLELKKECSLHSGEIRIIDGDLVDINFRKKLVNRVLNDSGRIDYLINNAGYGKLEALEKISYEDLEGMVVLNFIALQHLCQLVLPLMKKKKSGRIINIASVAAFEPPPYFATYNATKYAVHGFTKSLSYELKGSGVSTSAVYPPRMKTGFWTIAFKCKGLSGGEQKKCVEEWTKKSAGSLSVAKFTVRNLDNQNVILLPGVLPKVAYHILRHFKFVGNFFMRTSGLKNARKALSHMKLRP
jgi:uncharacterized protein